MEKKNGDKVSPVVKMILEIHPTDIGEIIEVNDTTVCVEFIQPKGHNLKVVVPKSLVSKPK